MSAKIVPELIGPIQREGSFDVKAAIRGMGGGAGGRGLVAPRSVGGSHRFGALALEFARA
jgi:hypothetical protein